MGKSYNPLGKNIATPGIIDPSVLYFIERKNGSARTSDVFDKLKIKGEDIWNCYEFSWLDKNKVPQMGICRLRYDANSRFIVESKSLKLYLAGFYNTVFFNKSQAEEIIYNTLDPKLLASKLNVSVIGLEEEDRYSIIGSTSQAFCLDKLDSYQNELVSGNEVTEDYIISHAFRSICPVTSQPDWATIEIHYRGLELPHKSVLGYLVSYREHAGYHEDVCEKIYLDLHNITKPEFMFVRCNFLRRGGIDINPVRYSPKYNYNPTPTRLLRQ